MISMEKAALSFWLRRLGIPGAAGGALLLTAMWMQTSWLPAQQTKLETLSSDIRHVRHDLQHGASEQDSFEKAKAGHPWNLGGLSPQDAWQTVWDTLPDEGQRLSLLSTVTTSARKQGVNLASVQYRGAVESWSIQGGQALWRQRVTMPVEGRYGDVRAWLGALLNQSSLSLDTLDITRADTATDQVKGRVSVSLWWRTAQVQAKGPAPTTGQVK